jgi:hypothetical protein
LTADSYDAETDVDVDDDERSGEEEEDSEEEEQGLGVRPLFPAVHIKITNYFLQIILLTIAHGV